MAMTEERRKTWARVFLRGGEEGSEDQVRSRQQETAGERGRDREGREGGLGGSRAPPTAKARESLPGQQDGKAL